MEIVDEAVKRYLPKHRIKEEYISSPCPFHKGGQERHPSFWVHRGTGKWGCFACHESGPDLRSLLKKLGVRNRSMQTLLDGMAKEAERNKAVEEVRKRKRSRATFKGEYILPESLLGVYDWCPIELVEAGFDEQVLKDHDVGYDQKLERITFPIRDIYGNLVGISGRNLPGVYPKYKIYDGKRTRPNGDVVDNELGGYFEDYESKDIRNHLWRAHKVFDDIIKGELDQLIVVEGYKACLWLVQNGWTQTVALMGSGMTKAQERIIYKMGVHTWVLLDNNPPGKVGADKVCGRLARGIFPVYKCAYPNYCDEDAQPDDLSEQELETVLSTAQRTGGKRWRSKRTGTA